MIVFRYRWNFNGSQWYTMTSGIDVPQATIHAIGPNRAGDITQFTVQIQSDWNNRTPVRMARKTLAAAMDAAIGCIGAQEVQDYARSKLAAFEKITDKKGKTWDKLKRELTPVLEANPDLDIAVEWEPFDFKESA